MEGDEITKQLEKEARKKAYQEKRLRKLQEKSGKNTENRIPPGQHYSARFQVLDLGNRPNMDIENDWTLTVTCNGNSKEYTLQQLKKLGVEDFTEDFHCVTTWSALDLKWKGIPFKNIIEDCSDIIGTYNWKFLIQTGKDGYTTNAPRADVEKDNVFLAFEYDGKPIPKEHGYIRIIIPHLYGWKSSKFLVAIEFRETDAPGYWETKGYSNVGNVWEEDRYSSAW